MNIGRVYQRIIVLCCIVWLGCLLGMQRTQAATPGMFVFISLSMPAAQLREIASEARRLRAVLLLRAFPDTSVAATAAAYRVLFSDAEDTVVQVDPFLFHDYGVTKVPVYILPLQLPLDQDSWRRECQSQLQPCPPQLQVARVAGAYSMAEALLHMRDKAVSRTAASALLQELGGVR